MMRPIAQSIWKLFLPGCALLALSSVLVCAVDTLAEEGPELAAEAPPYSVWIPHHTECCPMVVELRVREEGSEEERSLELTGRMTRITHLQPVGGPRLLIVGDLRYGGSNLWIVNLEALEREAEIWTFGYGLSPSGRYLAYQSHYPPRALPAARRSIFLLYDLSKPPTQGRLPTVGGGSGRSVGVPIFPEQNAMEPSSDASKAELVYSLSSPFLWSDDEREVVFVVVGRVPGESERRSFVARVRLDSDGHPRDVQSQLLSPENIEAPASTVPIEHLQAAPLIVTLESLEWTDEKGEGWVVGKTALPGDVLGPRVLIRLPTAGTGGS